MLVLYLIQQLSMAIFCYSMVIISSPRAYQWKRVVVTGAAYCASHLLIALAVFFLTLPKGISAFAFLALGFLAPCIGLKDRDRNIAIRWATAYAFATTISVGCRIGTFYFFYEVFKFETYEIIYAIALILTALLMIGIGRLISAKRLLKYIRIKRSLAATIFIWGVTIGVYAFMERLSYSTAGAEIRRVQAKAILPFYAIVFLMAVTWIIEMNVERFKRYGAEKRNHENRGIIKYTEQIMRDLKNKILPDEDSIDLVLKKAGDFHRSEAANADSEKLPRTGCGMIDGLIRIYAAACREKEILFRVQMGEPIGNCRETCGLDADELYEVLDYLMQNAVEALHPGGTLQLALFRDEGGFYEIDVEDNGTPFDPYVLEHWGEEGLTTKPDGHGFGVSKTVLILSKVGASLYIYQPREDGEHKCVGIRFDGRDEFRPADMREKPAEPLINGRRG